MTFIGVRKSPAILPRQSHRIDCECYAEESKSVVSPSSSVSCGHMLGTYDQCPTDVPTGESVLYNSS